jgi:hypothetical protein
VQDPGESDVPTVAAGVGIDRYFYRFLAFLRGRLRAVDTWAHNEIARSAVVGVRLDCGALL